MALTWDLGKIDRFNEMCYIPVVDEDGVATDKVQLNPTTESLIWATMSVGISKISDSNYVAFYKRLKCLERTGIYLLSGFDDENNVVNSNPSLEDIYFHRGLSTNVTKITEAQFCKRLGEGLMEKVHYEVKQQVKEFKNDSIIETVAV